MNCKHEHIKCVNCVKYCILCGAELPPDFVPGAVEKPQEEPKKPAKRRKEKAE